MRTISDAIASIATATTLFMLSFPASAQDSALPARSPGQWEVKMVPQTAGAPPAMAMAICVDEASDTDMLLASLALATDMCSSRTIEQDGDDYVIEAKCQTGEMTTNSRIVLSGDFQSAYTAEITTETMGAIGAMAGTNFTKQEARWRGAACADGLVPGQMEMPGTVKMNATDMMNKMDGQ